MGQVHISEADVVRDIRSVLDKVSTGAEVVVDRGDHALAIITPAVSASNGPGRPIGECIALARARKAIATLDDQFAADLAEAVSDKPLDSSWV